MSIRKILSILPLLAAGIMPMSAHAAAAVRLVSSDINKPGELGSTPFLDAILEGETQLIASMIAAGADVNYMPTFSEEDLYGDNPYATPLIMACSGHTPAQVEIVTQLLKAGADANLAMPDSGWTPLMAAASMDRIDLVSLLLEAGANADAKTSNGSTALAHACGLQSVESVDALLRAGADAKVLGENGRNLYFSVLSAGGMVEAPPINGVPARVVLIKMLRAKDVDVNQADAHGETALTTLIQMGGAYSSAEEVLAIARCLVDLGANPSLKNKKGESALSLAESQGKTQLAAILKKAGR